MLVHLNADLDNNKQCVWLYFVDGELFPQPATPRDSLELLDHWALIPAARKIYHTTVVFN